MDVKHNHLNWELFFKCPKYQFGSSRKESMLAKGQKHNLELLYKAKFGDG